MREGKVPGEWSLDGVLPLPGKPEGVRGQSRRDLAEPGRLPPNSGLPPLKTVPLPHSRPPTPAAAQSTRGLVQQMNTECLTCRVLLGNLAGVPAVLSVQSKDQLTGKNSPTHGSHGTARNESGTLGNGLIAYERTL